MIKVNHTDESANVRVLGYWYICTNSSTYLFKALLAFDIEDVHTLSRYAHISLYNGTSRYTRAETS